MNLMSRIECENVGVTEDFYPQTRIGFIYNPEAIMDARALGRTNEIKDQFRAELERVMSSWE